MSDQARIDVEKVGDRIQLAAIHGGAMVIQFRLTEDQALELCGRIMKHTSAQIILDASKAPVMVESEDFETPEPPHSRACVIRQHSHGRECSANCPTCGGRESAPTA